MLFANGFSGNRKLNVNRMTGELTLRSRSVTSTTPARDCIRSRGLAPRSDRHGRAARYQCSAGRAVDLRLGSSVPLEEPLLHQERVRRNGSRSPCARRPAGRHR